MADPGNIVKRTSQYIDNISFDETTFLPMGQVAGTDGANVYKAPVNADGLGVATGLVPKIYDYISIPSYDANGNPLTVIYKRGGSGGTTVATLTMTWDASSNPLTVTRT